MSEYQPVVVNVGCGAAPTPGAVNLDNSLSVSLAKNIQIGRILQKIHLVSSDQLDYAEFCSKHGIIRASCFSLPLADHSADVIYTSHMMEHLPKDSLPLFFREVRRVLKPDGFFRIVLPDTAILVKEYLRDGNCDHLIESMLLCPEIGTVSQRIRLALFGHRFHHWMYDASSFKKILQENGFSEIQQLPAGKTGIPFKTQIDLKEREDESFYLECKPAIENGVN